MEVVFVVIVMFVGICLVVSAKRLLKLVVLVGIAVWLIAASDITLGGTVSFMKEAFKQINQFISTS